MLRQAQAEEKLRAAAKLARPAIERVDLRVCSMEELLGKVRGLDAIITDPPYAAEHVPLYGDLARLAKKALKPHGVLAVMCGLICLPQIMEVMRGHISYRWAIAYMMPGQATQVFLRKVNCNWKPVLVFGGEKWIPRDVVNAEQDKTFHVWGQGEGGIGRIIDMLTEPDDLIADPFLGTGTTAVAAIKLHRRIVGCDVDAAQVEKAQARAALAQEQATKREKVDRTSSALTMCNSRPSPQSGRPRGVHPSRRIVGDGGGDSGDGARRHATRGVPVLGRS